MIYYHGAGAWPLVEFTSPAACIISLLLILCSTFLGAACQRVSPIKGYLIHHSYVGSCDNDGWEDPSIDYETESPEDHKQVRSIGRLTTNHGRLLLTVGETTAVLGMIFVHLVNAVATDSVSKSRSRIALVTWLYIGSLQLLRLILPREASARYGLWYHTAWLYSVQWLLGIWVLRSVVIRPEIRPQRSLAILNFVISTLLFIIAMTSTERAENSNSWFRKNLSASPEESSSIFSLATFSWMSPLVWRAQKPDYHTEDLWHLGSRERSRNIVEEYRLVKKTSGLAWHLFRHSRRAFLIQGAWAALASLTTFVRVFVLQRVLIYMEDPLRQEQSDVWTWILIMLFSGVLTSVSNGQSLWMGRKIGIRLRAILIDEIYSKTLLRSASARPRLSSDQTNENRDTQLSSGAITNLMALDSTKVADISGYLHYIWVESPVQIIVAITLLYRLLGWSATTGVLVMLILMPVNVLISRKFSQLQRRIMSITDQRVEETTEVLTNIRIIKYFVWEDRFLSKVSITRQKELKALRNRLFAYSAASALWSGAPMIITASTFFCYTCFAKNQLAPFVAFTALSLFGLLKGPLDQFTTMISQIQNSSGNKTDSDGSHMLAFENATLTWSSSDSTFKLIDLDLRLEIGQFYHVLGPTGSGKTSLLLALLGEMTKLRGTVCLPNTNAQGRITGSTSDIAYCSQEPWILNSTIRDNIIFGSAFNALRYQEVLTSCALQQDLAALEAGDDTLVGEKGAALSGGQKHRVALARAIYSDAQLILLDDVLSAVDSHTSKWIFDKALCGPLMEGRTCIFVTHGVRLCLSAQHSAIILDNGRVTAKGLSLELLKAGKLDGLRKKALSADDVNDFDVLSTDKSIHSTGITEEPKLQVPEDPATKNKNKDHEQDHLLENKTVGRIRIKTSLSYMRAMGGFTFWICVLIVFVARQGVQVLSNMWITWWSNASTEAPTHPLSLPLSANHTTYYSTIYITLVACYMLISFLRDTIVFKGSITASHIIHSRMLNAVVRARFAFFDFTSLGQLLNRFSKDIEVLDQEIVTMAVGVVNCVASVITTIILVASIIPQFLIVVLAISVVYAIVGKLYINASRELKRLEAIQRSPLFQHLGETISGAVTIRAYGAEARFSRKNLKTLDDYTRPYIYLWATNRWLAFRVDFVGTLVSVCTAATLVLCASRLSAGAAGLAMTYAVTFTDNILWFVRLYAFNEQNMTSIERMEEFSICEKNEHLY